MSLNEADPARLMRFVLELRQAGVTDRKTLAAMERTPRALFAPDHLSALALEDVALPLAHDQSLTKPSVVGRMIAALLLTGGELVLEVGTGSGYQTAALALMARKVTTLERHRPLVADARARFGGLRLMNVQAHVADGRAGWPDGAPYDRIIVNAAAESPPPALLDQLAPDGLLLMPTGARLDMRLMRFRKSAEAPEDLGRIDMPALQEGIAEE
ncbi:MAG: protein-L-isoaspartate O-methyltransferase [Hyphomonadaceae bacterium]|nr:protein-L-isoaspartate O-methyltransferase [Hyphomonadaceae bacterium]